MPPSDGTGARRPRGASFPCPCGCRPAAPGCLRCRDRSCSCSGTTPGQCRRCACPGGRCCCPRRPCRGGMPRTFPTAGAVQAADCRDRRRTRSGCRRWWSIAGWCGFRRPAWRRGSRRRCRSAPSRRTPGSRRRWSRGRRKPLRRAAACRHGPCRTRSREPRGNWCRLLPERAPGWPSGGTGARPRRGWPGRSRPSCSRGERRCRHCRGRRCRPAPAKHRRVR